jgi:hypothetical protein
MERNGTNLPLYNCRVPNTCVMNVNALPLDLTNAAVYMLFNGVLSSSHYIASNDEIIDQ